MSTPAAFYLSKLEKLKTGTMMAEAASMKDKMKTIMEGLLYFSIICFITFSPIIIPIVVLNPMRAAYGITRAPIEIYTRVEAVVPNRIIYMAVEVVTWGRTPKLRSKGLNTTPPPRPKAPTIPPKNEPSFSFQRSFPLYFTSPVTIPFLYFSFNYCLLLPSVTAMPVTTRLNIINPKRRVKSMTPHLEMPMIDGVLGDPLSMLTNREKPTRKMLITCTFHIFNSEPS
jgi:hypothetical protein